MRDRSERISRLLKSQESRAGYIKSKLAVLVPAQIRALRLKSSDPEMPRQRDLARQSGMHQSRISMFETPGAANITLETIAKIAGALRVGVVLKFVPFSEMLRWENSFSAEPFDVVRLSEDKEFINPSVATTAQSTSDLGAFARSAENELAANSQGQRRRQDSLPAQAACYAATQPAIEPAIGA